MPKEILCAFGIDVDAVAGWLGSYGGEDSPDDISRGLFAGEVGVPRLPRLFERYDLRTTWFTIHPDVSGRPQVLLMLERLIEHINGHDGIRWATFDEIADDYAARYPREGSSR